MEHEHKAEKWQVDDESVWVATTRASDGQRYVFYYAYDLEPPASLLASLERGFEHPDEQTNLRFNYLPIRKALAYTLSGRTRKQQIARRLRIKD